MTETHMEPTGFEDDPGGPARMSGPWDFDQMYRVPLHQMDVWDDLLYAQWCRNWARDPEELTSVLAFEEWTHAHWES